MDAVDYHPGPVDGSLLTRQSEHRSEFIWRGEDPGDLRTRVGINKYWVDVNNYPPPPEIFAAISAAGLIGVYQIGQFRLDCGLITPFVERWRPETHTFHFRFGEATITLEDVHFILGLPTDGVLVVDSFGTPSMEDRRARVAHVLGVYPGSDDVNKGGLKVSWLLEHFGRCHRLEYGSDDYGAQLTFHIRAHLFIILGSLFSNHTGNRIQLQLLPYVEDYDQIGRYSWGGAVLAYLYRGLCCSSIGKKSEIVGSMILLQVWIWEHFPTLAPTLLEGGQMEYPVSLRWKVRRSTKNVPQHQTRLVRYELDSMHDESSITWRPYQYVSARYLPRHHDMTLWTARCPLIYNAMVEYCYPDRVTRQFGRRQDIPDPPEENHERLHNVVNEGNDWNNVHEEAIAAWYTRSNMIFTLHRHPPIFERSCRVDYGPWFQSVTRRFISDPRTWPTQPGFQGTQGHAQYFAEGMSQVYHAIHPSDPHVVQARAIIRDRLDTTGYSSYRHTLPPQPPAPDTRRRHIATGRPRGRPRVERATPEPGMYFGEPLRHTPDPVDLGADDLDPHSEEQLPPHVEGWHPWATTTHTGISYGMTGWDVGGGSGASHEMMGGGTGDVGGGSGAHGMMGGGTGDVGGGSGGSHGIIGGGTATLLGFAGGPEVDYEFGTPVRTDMSSSPTSDFVGGSGGSLPLQRRLTYGVTPTSFGSGFQDFAGHANPWPTPPQSTVVEEEDTDVPRRNQPQRQVKGKGRICHTGSHMF